MSENKVGKPLKFKTVEELQKKIDDYFYSCNEESEPITITGLALALDTTRETLCDYEEKDEYSDAIKKAKLMVQHAYEKRLVKRGNGGDIFALKNFGWKDKSEVDNTLNIKSAFVEFSDGTSEGYNTDEVQTPAN